MDKFKKLVSALIEIGSMTLLIWAMSGLAMWGISTTIVALGEGLILPYVAFICLIALVIYLLEHNDNDTDYKKDTVTYNIAIDKYDSPQYNVNVGDTVMCFSNDLLNDDCTYVDNRSDSWNVESDFMIPNSNGMLPNGFLVVAEWLQPMKVVCVGENKLYLSFN